MKSIFASRGVSFAALSLELSPFWHSRLFFITYIPSSS